METTQHPAEKSFTGTELSRFDSETEVARPATSGSSATTIPPPSCEQSKEAICDADLDNLADASVPIGPVPSEGLAREKTQSQAKSSDDAKPVQDPAKKQDTLTKENHVGVIIQERKQPPNVMQRKLKSGPPQPKKTKRPYFGPVQTAIKKPAKTKAKVNQNGSKKLTTITSASNAEVPSNIEIDSAKGTSAPNRAGPTLQEKGTSNYQNPKNGPSECTGAPILKAFGETPARQACKSTKVQQTTKKSGEKQFTLQGTSTGNVSLNALKQGGTPIQKKSRTLAGDPKQKKQQKKITAALTKRSSVDTGPGGTKGVAVNKSKKGTKTRAKKGKDSGRCELTLEERYEDLSRRYFAVARELVQSPSKSSKGSNEKVEEADEKTMQTGIVDRRLYETIHLSKMAGMLGSMKIEEEPGEYLRWSRPEGFENAHERIILDGFRFVEDLMLIGEPEKDCASSVAGVFRKIHLRMLTDLWEKNHNKEGGRIVVERIMKKICSQVKEWYMKIIWGKISIRWSGFISEELTEVLYDKMKGMNERLANEVVKMGQDVLREISRLYQQAEKEGSQGCLEMFFNSCEVAVCVARSVREAALSLEEEDAYAIGRHNGVFSYCVVRLQAERDAEESEGGAGKRVVGS